MLRRHLLSTRGANGNGPSHCSHHTMQHPSSPPPSANDGHAVQQGGVPWAWGASRRREFHCTNNIYALAVYSSRTSTPSSNTISNPSPSWSSVSGCVGDSGAILGARPRIILRRGRNAIVATKESAISHGSGKEATGGRSTFSDGCFQPSLSRPSASTHSAGCAARRRYSI